MIEYFRLSGFCALFIVGFTPQDGKVSILWLFKYFKPKISEFKRCFYSVFC